MKSPVQVKGFNFSKKSPFSTVKIKLLKILYGGPSGKIWEHVPTSQLCYSGHKNTNETPVGHCSEFIQGVTIRADNSAFLDSIINLQQSGRGFHLRNQIAKKLKLF